MNPNFLATTAQLSVAITAFISIVHGFQGGSANLRVFETIFTLLFVICGFCLFALQFGNSFGLTLLLVIIVGIVVTLRYLEFLYLLIKNSIYHLKHILLPIVMLLVSSTYLFISSYLILNNNPTDKILATIFALGILISLGVQAIEAYFTLRRLVVEEARSWANRFS